MREATDLEPNLQRQIKARKKIKFGSFSNLKSFFGDFLVEIKF
jgi:hypothetical protein